MIRQNERSWVLDDTPRQWVTHHQGKGDPVLARRYPTPGVELDTDYPPTVELSADEWADLTASIEADLSDDDRAAEISRRLDALVWPKGVPGDAKS